MTGNGGALGDMRGPNGAGGPSWRDSVVALIPALRAFAWSLSHNSAEADDLVQDALIKAWAHRDRFHTGTNLRAWLFTILRNTYYTAAVRRRREVSDEDGQYAASLSTGPTQEWSLAVRSIQSAMAQLPDEHREALILVGAAGLTYEEAAEVCGCALGTIKSRVNRARARLLKIMDAQAPSDALAVNTAGAPRPRLPDPPFNTRPSGTMARTARPSSSVKMR
jgi:RNA polymerase sigma-70 factor (ECF subfamily)